MAVTRREFVTTLGMLAASVGLSQSQIAQVTEAFGHARPWNDATAGTGWTNKPKVIWVHGAECTGCSTSLLSLFEDASGIAVPGHATLGDISTATALAAVGGAGVLATGAAVTALGTTSASHPNSHRTLQTAGLNVDGSAYAVNIADVLIDFIDLQYHETVMAAGGDGAYGYLAHEMAGDDGTPFVMVVEGAVQKYENGGYWNKPGTVTAGEYDMAPWCAIAMDGTADTEHELSFDRVVKALASRGDCKAIVAIGQCACFGGYPACQGPDLVPNAYGKSMTGAKGVYDYLVGEFGSGAASPCNKVVNSPGCPTNPWWFTLTVVAWLVDVVTGPGKAVPTAGALGILGSDFGIIGGVDSSRRLTAVYGNLLHGKYCPRYPKYAARIFAAKPGDDGCLKNLGCKGISTMSSCGRHGWNGLQPQNTNTNSANEDLCYLAADGTTKIGGNCLNAGHPCMGCTEKGYPDAMTPFVVR